MQLLTKTNILMNEVRGSHRCCGCLVGNVGLGYYLTRSNVMGVESKGADRIRGGRYMEDSI